MSVWSKYCLSGARFCGDCALSFLCWALWLVLALLLAVQLGVAVSNELSVPGFLLRSLESRLAASHLQLRFGRAVFDPSGRILIEDVKFALPDFEEPVATARAIYVTLDPWAAIVGRFEPEQVQVTGLDVAVPAMLAPSGRNEPMLQSVDLVLTPAEHEFVIDRLSGRAGGVPVELRGRFALPRAPVASGESLPLAAFLAQRFPAICRSFIAASARLALVDDPSLHVVLRPSTSRGAIARVEIFARTVRVPGAHPATLSGVHLSTQLPVLGDRPTSLVVAVEADAVTAGPATLRRPRLRVRGLLRPAAPAFELRGADAAAAEVTAEEFALRTPVLHVAGSLPSLRAELLATYAGLPLAVSGSADLDRRRGEAHVDALLPPTLVDTIGHRIGRDLGRFISFGAPAEVHARATFAPGWKFAGASGRFAASQIDGYGVVFDRVTGEFAGDLHHVVTDHLYGQVGANFARGRFEQDFASHDYRFLLEGRLRPMEIAPWFHEWWPNFFHQLEFADAPPDASVDVRGRWKDAPSTSVFVFATSAARPVFRGAQFDYARTLLFIRPNFIDGLEIFGTRGASELRTSFQRYVDVAANEWSAMDIDAFSTLDFATGRALLGPAVGDQLKPFVFARPPRITVKGHFDGPAAPAGPHHHLAIEAESNAAFGFYGFPFDRVAFHAAVDDDTITVTQVEAGIAGGTLTGSARVSPGPQGRRLGFDASLSQARLGSAVTTVERYVALRRGDATPPPDRFLTGKSSVLLDAALSADGLIDDVYSFHGSGNALIAGSELGEVRLLGGLSQLLNFTALRFTSARTGFRLDGRTLTFPDVNVIGANSAIEAEGTYGLENHALDFKARVYPFRESKSFLQSFVGTVLTPLSRALEVRLTGPLDNPAWSFVLGPTSLLRALGGPDTPPPAPAPATAPASTPPAPPPDLQR